MEIAEYQRWLEEYDRLRGWDRVSPSQTFVHLMEELGEVARLVLHLEGYKPGEGREDEIKAELAEELGDTATFLFKIAYQFGIDMEVAMKGNMPKAESRYSVKEGRADMARYIQRQEENLARIKGALDKRSRRV
jgi:NTP pyrophosphatase (non-canonical NTP hydrolase)